MIHGRARAPMRKQTSRSWCEPHESYGPHGWRRGEVYVVGRVDAATSIRVTL